MLSDDGYIQGHIVGAHVSWALFLQSGFVNEIYQNDILSILFFGSEVGKIASGEREQHNFENMRELRTIGKMP